MDIGTFVDVMIVDYNLKTTVGEIQRILTERGVVRKNYSLNKGDFNIYTLEANERVRYDGHTFALNQVNRKAGGTLDEIKVLLTRVGQQFLYDSLMDKKLGYTK